MHIFIKKSFLFIAISLLVFFVFGLYSEYIIGQNVGINQFQIQEDWHVKHSEKNRILFIGNSRTWVQVDAKLLSEKLKVKVYCLAQDGRDAYVLFWKLKTYLTFNEAPEQIFLQYDPYFLMNINHGTFYGKQNYLAYIFGDKLKINRIFYKELGFHKYEAFVPLKRYFNTEDGLSILLKHLAKNNSSVFGEFKYGSELKNIKWNSSLNWVNPDSILGDIKFDYIDSIAKICRNKNIQLTLVYPPQSFTSYRKLDKNILVRLENYAVKEKLKFWNFNNKKYNDSNMFYNHMHTNRAGSLIYTNELFDSINLN